MNTQISVTKMELFKLRRRLSTAVRGHKLLKDKNKGLMREFLSFVKAYKEVRQKVDRDLPDCMRMFVLARVVSSSQSVSEALEQSKGALGIKVSRRSILSIKVPVFEVSVNEKSTYSLINTPVELDGAIVRLKELFPDIIRSAELEQSIRFLAQEIEKTRRRVNALEYVLIPQLQNSIRYIKVKLDEAERSTMSRIMKVKEALIRKD